MIRTRLRLALAFFVVVGAVVLASSGGAGPRLAKVDFNAFPGPGKVTYGELIAYKFEFENLSGTTLTHVRARQTIPVAEGEFAIFDSSTCPSTPTTVSTSNGTEWVCNFGHVPAGTSKLELTVVWRVRPLEGTENCTNCLVSTGRWTVKEGLNDVSDPNDVLLSKTVTATLLGAGDDSEETLLAGGFETTAASCADSQSAGNLKTHGAIGLLNPIITKYCLPNVLLPPGNGYASTITETLGNARHTDVCIAALGTNCDAGYVDENFFLTGKVVTVVIQVADAALPKGYKITTVSHNNVTMTAATCASAGDCVLDIDLDSKTKVWTIVVTSGKNGFYDF